MKSKYSAHYSLLSVVLAHAAVLAAVIYTPKTSAPIIVEPPTIQGVIVASEPIPEPPPLPPPPVEKPVPKPKLPIPKGPASERAITQEVEPEPATPPVEPQKMAEPAPVEPPRADASQLNNPAPIYPSQSRRLREEGIVLLEILVKADGTLGEMRLKKSSGHERLDESAQRAVKNWRFLPARRGSEAIDFWYELPIEFSLNH